MIRSRWIINTTPLDGLSDYAAHFEEHAFENGERVYDSLEQEVLDELREYPSPPAGSDYVRTYRLRNGWQINLVPASGGFTIEVLNDAVDSRGVEYPKYVKGSLAKARATAAKAQAWMHKGRWPLAFGTVEAFYELFFEAYNESFARDLSAFGSTSSSRRAFTR